ncbi:MAG: host attachment protein [Cyanobacteria bacterium P01_F01_bin.116]
MRSYLVAVVDGAQARFFTLTTAEFSDQEPSGPHLTEHSSLNNVEKPIASKGSNNRKQHGNRHEKTTVSVEANRRFAHQVLQHISSVNESFGGHHLILVAEPHILGSLRESSQNYLPSTMVVSELAKDLCRLNAHDLHKYLANKELLPTSKRGVQR